TRARVATHPSVSAHANVGRVQEQPGLWTVDDGELARRIAKGGSVYADAAGSELVRRFAPRNRLLCLRRLRDQAAAQGLLHEVLVTTREALGAGRIEQPERLASFVLGACRMTVANQRRGEQRRARLLAQFAHDLVPSLPSSGSAHLDRDRLADCLA